jgi:hypothetical protein
MTLTLDISPEAEERLGRRAEREGVDLPKLAAGLLEDLSLDEPEAPKPRTGAELVAQWEADGVIGAWAHRDDITDSQEYARQLRAEAERRGR